MNSYDENLQNTVAATLQSQNLDLKSLTSQYKASMYTLYYAEGATITADEKLDAATTDLGHKTKVKEQAVKNMSISANQLNSSTQANQYDGQSVTNMSTCASNVQIAATAITRLAADVGGIFSIVNAADFGTDIYTLTDQVKGLVNTTAYNAEVTSQVAMEASAATSEVSTSTVLNDAKATNALMNTVLQVASGDFNTASQTVAADNATLAAVNTSEKLAEGAFESSDIDLLAGLSAYESVNSGLNLGLTALALSSDSFLVFFERIKAPFPPPVPPIVNSPIPMPVIPAAEWYPVSDYYVFVVKESKQLTFTISEAENLRINGKGQFVKISYQDTLPADRIILEHSDMIAQVIEYRRDDSSGKKVDVLKDSDGDPIKPGDKYVVFVMAVYEDQYKRLINNFDDFLSAPSLSFNMTTLLNSANNVTIVPVTEIENLATLYPAIAKSVEKEFDITKKIISELEDSKYVMFFEAASPDTKAKMGCECMFLPVNITVPETLITRSAFDSFTKDQVKFDKIKLQNTRKILIECITDLQVRIKAITGGKTPADSADNAVSVQPDNISQFINLLQTKLDELSVDNANTQITFFFNKELAEIVPAGSSTTATQIIAEISEKEKIATNFWYAFIGPATTDNFGNLLSGDISYAPAILSLSTSDDEATVKAYTDNISDYETVQTFKY